MSVTWGVFLPKILQVLTLLSSYFYFSTLTPLYIALTLISSSLTHKALFLISLLFIFSLLSIFPSKFSYTSFFASQMATVEVYQLMFSLLLIYVCLVLCFRTHLHLGSDRSFYNSNFDSAQRICGVLFD